MGSPKEDDFLNVGVFFSSFQWIKGCEGKDGEQGGVGMMLGVLQNGSTTQKQFSLHVSQVQSRVIDRKKSSF